MNFTHDCTGIGPFKFKNKSNSSIEIFLNGFNDRKNNFDYVPDNQEYLNIVTNKLFLHNIFDKYTVRIQETLNANSLFENDKQGSIDKIEEIHDKRVKGKNEEVLKENIRNIIQNNYQNSTLIKEDNKISNFKNFKDQNNNSFFDSNNKPSNSNNKIKEEIKDQVTSKYFSVKKQQSSSNLLNSKILLRSPKKEKGKDIAENNNGNNNDINNSNNMSSILNGVNIVISGIENPERGEIRNLALKMGAKYQPKWTYSSTHLICAIKGTPKYNEVKALGHGKIVKPLWIYDCYEKKKRLLENNYSFDYQKKTENSSDENELDDTLNTGDSKSQINNNGSFIKDDDRSSSQSMDDDKENIINSNNDLKDNSNNNNKMKKLNKFSLLLSIPDIFKDLCFYFDDTIHNKSKNELERYVLGHGGQISSDVDNKVTHYCTMKKIDEITFNGKVINPTYIIDCHNNNSLL